MSGLGRGCATNDKLEPGTCSLLIKVILFHLDNSSDVRPGVSVQAGDRGYANKSFFVITSSPDLQGDHISKAGLSYGHR